MLNPKVGDRVSYPDWTGLKTRNSSITVVINHNGKRFYNLANGDQLDDEAFINEGAEIEVPTNE